MKVILLSIHDDEEYVSRAMAAGASGYLLKTSERSRSWSSPSGPWRGGGTYLTPNVARHVFAAPAAAKPARRPPQGAPDAATAGRRPARSPGV